MATITVSVPKKVVSYVSTDVALEDLPGCTWQFVEGVQLNLLDAATQDVVGTMTEHKDMTVRGKLVPKVTSFNNVCDGLRNAYQSMKNAGVW